MNKRQRAFASMILTWVLIVGIPTILIVIVLFVGGQVRGNANMITLVSQLASLIVVIIELCAVAIALVALHHYFRYYRSSVFIFKGFSNAAKLVDIDHVPVDLDKLAREELAYQFRLVYGKLMGAYAEDDQEKCDNRHISPSDLYAEETRAEDEAEWFLPDENFHRQILNARNARLLADYLKKRYSR